MHYARPMEKPVDPRAQRLVTISHWLGWGGILLLFIGGPAAGIIASVNAGRGSSAPMAIGSVISLIGLLSAIIGAIVGQVGRGMQGRVV
jgi:hypothetical protein